VGFRFSRRNGIVPGTGPGAPLTPAKWALVRLVVGGSIGAIAVIVWSNSGIAPTSHYSPVNASSTPPVGVSATSATLAGATPPAAASTTPTGVAHRRATTQPTRVEDTEPSGSPTEAPQSSSADPAELFRREVKRTASRAGLDLGADAGPAFGWGARGMAQEQFNKAVMSSVVINCMGKSPANGYGTAALLACEESEVATPSRDVSQ
jgi:hypothetical protein